MSYTGNEIITLQFGHYSNFVGTHLWNLQEAGFEYIPDSPSEVNHDVMFREGETLRGEVTFTPRLLLVDLKGSLGALPEGGRLYHSPLEPDASLSLWPADKVALQTEPEQPKNEFQQDLVTGESSAAPLPDGSKEKGLAVPKLYHLDDVVKSWSDYLRPHLHPRSINIVREYQHGNSAMPFDTFPQGQAVWSNAAFNEEFTDRVRLYLEEADNLQGFQVLMDTWDGFSGLGCAGLQYLRDQYPSKSVLVVACRPAPYGEQHQHVTRLVNQVLAHASLAEHSSLFVPVGGELQLPHVRHNPELYYHTSALVASALDTLSLIYRLRTSSLQLSELVSAFAQNGRVAAALSLCLPLPLRASATLLDTLESWEGPLTRPLTPSTDLSDTQWLQAYVLRGVNEDRLMRQEQRNLGSSNPAYACRNLSELLRTYVQFTSQSSGFSRVTTADSALPTTSPFPNIFTEDISQDGYLAGPRPQHYGVSKVAALAGLHNCKGLGSSLESLHSEAKRVNIRSLHQFVSTGLESTELSESLEQLLCLSECYSEHLDI